jgi:hypothetical protein
MQIQVFYHLSAMQNLPDSTAMPPTPDHHPKAERIRLLTESVAKSHGFCYLCYV